MNETFGYLFPGQGAQFVGMGLDLYETFPASRDVYERAEQILELPLKRLSFEGPEDELRQTRYTQPAILVHSLAALAALPDSKPMLAAGHSLGEYSALFCAGCIDFESALRLVKKRGELMFAEGKKNPGTMAAILGLDAASVESLCRDISGVVVPANYNEPKQTVISGEPEAVKQAAEAAKQRGALKTVLLPVSGAFHSPLLAESGREFTEFLSGFAIRDAAFPVVMNVTGRPSLKAAEIRDNLSRQLTSPVRWTEVITTAVELGCRSFLEVGPGSILAGLARRINRELTVLPAGRKNEIGALARVRGE